ncbi:MAG: hypothetical protein PHY08_01285 [Candidatus Cloacimonetes bacterium]|jgi:hydrogenase-4 component E|nr:hypothetical protein [Candidatus Cloacimonadota bacterium]MDD4155180.1 hypothetical protein [Candidatus Cloacimonadota bacterium]
MLELLLVIFSISILLAVMTGRLIKYINILAVQGFILFLLVLFSYRNLDIISIIFLTFETLIFKSIMIPYFLRYTIKKNEISREMQANIPAFYSLIIASIILIGGFLLSYLLSNTAQHYNIKYFGVSIATIMISLFLILSRKKIITHVMCFLMLENGIFLLSISISHEMPILINLAVLLDIFLAVLLLGVFTSHVKVGFDELHIDKISVSNGVEE